MKLKAEILEALKTKEVYGGLSYINTCRELTVIRWIQSNDPQLTKYSNLAYIMDYLKSKNLFNITEQSQLTDILSF